MDIGIQGNGVYIGAIHFPDRKKASLVVEKQDYKEQHISEDIMWFVKNVVVKHHTSNISTLQMKDYKKKHSTVGTHASQWKGF